uniref:Uncharacterized protein n=1 Tax=Noccaea caerulescens TaxID=107243 RepID=A0A1J3GYL8_NOCCA
MENHSEPDSSQILGNWDVLTTSGSDDPSKEVEKETRTRASDRERGSMAEKEKTVGRILPSWMDPSYEWGDGKWKEDGRKKKKKEKEKEKEKESDVIPFKEIFETLHRNSGKKVEEEDEEKGKNQSYVNTLKSMGLKFP